MRAQRKAIIALVVALGPSLAPVGIGSQREALAGSALRVQQAGGTITITDLTYDPAELAVKVGETITIINNDDTIHSVTARDGTFDVDVPPKGRATLTVPKAGSFPYSCAYHSGLHNPATISAS